jgi:hypothetical protein
MENIDKGVLRYCIIFLCLILVAWLLIEWQKSGADNQLHNRECVEAGTVKAISTPETQIGR